ncbi:hypothetical protein SNE40_008851 [Patella caerulea]|uniref:RRM domain-containing protein n=2 Tax=Patella caerulea TaxID=87958 RepID=A0AAN8JQT6_PATCE
MASFMRNQGGNILQMDQFMNNAPISASERATRSVFVGNIPYEATEEQLKDIFIQAGPVVSFRLVYDRETGKPKGYGFCEYQDTETAQSAMRNLNNHDFNGRPLRVGVAAGENNKEEMKGMQQAFGGPVLESPYGDPVEPEKAPEAISQAVASLPPEQMFELMKQMKLCIQNNPNEARNMLLANPQLAYALLQAQIVMKIVDPQVALTMLYRDTSQPGSDVQSGGDVGMTPRQGGPVPLMGGAMPQMGGPGPQIGRPGPQMGGLGPQIGGPGPQIGGPGPQIGGPGTQMRGPQPLMGGPGPQMGGPGPQMGGPGPQMGGPGPQMGGPGPQMGGPGPQMNRGGPGPHGIMGDVRGGSTSRGQMGGPDMGGPFPNQDLHDPRMMGDMPARSMAQAVPSRSMAQGLPGLLGSGVQNLAGLANITPGTQISAQDQEKAALIMQVLQLTDQQISILPPEQRQSILILKDQIAKSAQ